MCTPPTAGSIAFDGQAVHFRSPHDARDAGIETVHQNLALVEDLTVWQNLFLNREMSAGSARSRSSTGARCDAKARGDGVGARGQRARGRITGAPPVGRPAASRVHLPRSRLQLQVIIMDEPTAALGVQETATRRGADHQAARSRVTPIILISHNFAQVLQLSDAVWVMRAGRCVAGGAPPRPTATRSSRLLTGAARRLRPPIARTQRMTPTVEVPNPIGVHALVWVGDTSPASVESAVAQTVAGGFDLLEFSLHDAVNLDSRKTRELLTANGIAAACSRGLACDADVSSDDPAVVARGAELLAESLAVTHEHRRHDPHRRPLQRVRQVRRTR